MTGVMFILCSVLLVYFSSRDHSFSFIRSISNEYSTLKVFRMEIGFSDLAFILFCVGFSLLIPIWPLHQWFLSLIQSSHRSLFVVFCGAVVPVFMVTFIRSLLIVFPDQIQESSILLLLVGGVNLVVGAMLLVKQRDLKSFIVYSFLGYIGLFVLSVGSLSELSIVGVVYYLCICGLAYSLLALFTSAFIERVSSSAVFLNRRFGGIIQEAPFLGMVVAVSLMTLVGIPGLGGFVAQTFILMGGYSVNPIIVCVILMSLLLIIYGLFGMYKSVFFGTGEDKTSFFNQMNLIEKVCFVPFVLTIVFLGIFPQPLLNLIQPTVSSIMAGYIH